MIFLVIFSQVSILLIDSNTDNYLLALALSQYLFLFLPSYIILNYLKYNFNMKFPISVKLHSYHFIVIFLIIILTQLSGNLIFYLTDIIFPQELIDFLEKVSQSLEETYDYLLSFKKNSPLIVIFAIALTPAICEEFLFRGYLQNILKQKYSINKSIIITSLVFSIVHLNPLSFLGIFLLSCAIGFYKEKTNSLKIPILIHFINNFISIVLYNSMILFNIEI